MENGAANWTTGGTNNYWAITTEQSHSPTHAWSDSPNGNYLDNTNAWLRSPILDLSGTTDVTLSFWHRFALEDGWDFGYVEYSLDGGATWQATGSSYTGAQVSWSQQTLAMPAFAGQPEAAFRFRLQSDGGETDDGWYIDDVVLSYVPFACYDPVVPTGSGRRRHAGWL
jgi:bacillopeptidase F